MNLGVTVGTTVREELVDTWSGDDEVAGMTLETEKRHGRIEKMAVDRAVGHMTVGAVLGNVGMFESEWPLFFHVTAGTGFLGRIAPQELVLGRTVGIVTVNAGHFLLPDRMVGDETVLGLHLGVTAVAEFSHLFPTYLLLRALVELVTIEATDVIKRMRARIPVGKGRN